MRKYETPELKAIYFDVDSKIMDGYAPGDINENPWADLFKPEPSGGEENIDVNALDL